jgi:hypothetical protein
MRHWFHFLSAVLLLSFLALAALPGSSQEKGQPIAYNHAKHVTELEMGCLDCHFRAETAARATIPNIEVCGDCHEDTEVESAEERKVAQHVIDGERIAWRQVHRVPDHAYFSHRRHVALGEIECSTCHGDVAAMEEPFVKPYRPIKMSWCISCHENRSVTNECTACHR